MLVIASFKAVLPTCCQLLVLSKQLLHCPIYHCSSCSTLLLHFLLESQPVCDHISIFLQIWILSPLHSLLVGQFPSLIVEEAHDPWFFLWLFPSYQPHGFGECYPNPKPAEFIHLEVSIVMGVTPNERFYNGTSIYKGMLWEYPHFRKPPFVYADFMKLYWQFPSHPPELDQGATQGHIHKPSWVQMGHCPPRPLGSRPPSLTTQTFFEGYWGILRGSEDDLKMDIIMPWLIMP